MDRSTAGITPVAHAGAEDGYLAEINANLNDGESHGMGPAGQVIRSGQPVYFENLEREPAFAPWVEGASRRGYRGIVCLPLRDATRTFGLLALYTSEVKHTSADRDRRCARRVAPGLTLQGDAVNRRAGATWQA